MPPFGVNAQATLGAWLEAFEKLQPEQQDRVRRWIRLNKAIAQTLDIAWDDWVCDYLKPAMDDPLNYGFMQAFLPDFSGLDVEVGGDFDPG